ADQNVVTINLYNNIFYGNLDSYDEGNDTGNPADIRNGTLTVATAYLTLSNNLFQNDVVASINGRKTVTSPYKLNEITEEPLFASTTPTDYNFLWPVQNSFAINKGDNALYTIEDINTAKDRLGNDRLIGANIDLGAIEWSTVLPVKVSSF